MTPTVEIVEVGGQARGRFADLPERERRRIVQFVYRQELADRREPEPARLSRLTLGGRVDGQVAGEPAARPHGDMGVETGTM